MVVLVVTGSTHQFLHMVGLVCLPIHACLHTWTIHKVLTYQDTSVCIVHRELLSTSTWTWHLCRSAGWGVLKYLNIWEQPYGSTLLVLGISWFPLYFWVLACSWCFQVSLEVAKFTLVISDDWGNGCAFSWSHTWIFWAWALLVFAFAKWSWGAPGFLPHSYWRWWCHQGKA